MGSLGTPPSLNDIERPTTPHRTSRISRYVAPVSHLHININFHLALLSIISVFDVTRIRTMHDKSNRISRSLEVYGM